MKKPMKGSELMHRLILNDPRDAYAQLLRHCPFVQIVMLQQGYMTPDELTPDERNRIGRIINLEDLHYD